MIWTDLEFFSVSRRHHRYLVHYVFACPGPDSAYENGASFAREFPRGMVAVAEVVAMPGRPYLYEIHVTDQERRKGIGMALLREVVRRFGKVNALWASEAGAGLARAYEREHGPQGWNIQVLEGAPRA